MSSKVNSKEYCIIQWLTIVKYENYITTDSQGLSKEIKNATIMTIPIFKAKNSLASYSVNYDVAHRNIASNQFETDIEILAVTPCVSEIWVTEKEIMKHWKTKIEDLSIYRNEQA